MQVALGQALTRAQVINKIITIFTLQYSFTDITIDHFRQLSPKVQEAILMKKYGLPIVLNAIDVDRNVPYEWSDSVRNYYLARITDGPTLQLLLNEGVVRYRKAYSSSYAQIVGPPTG